MVPGTPDVPSEYEPYGRERCCGLNPASVEERGRARSPASRIPRETLFPDPLGGMTLAIGPRLLNLLSQG